MEKFQNKYRIPSSRARFWDYKWSAEYFITICTYNQIPCFGEIKDEEMILSELGEIVNTEWLKTFEIRPDMNLFMGEFVIMPNHFPAIIGIGENKYNTEKYLIDGGNTVDGRGCPISFGTLFYVVKHHIFILFLLLISILFYTFKVL